MTAPLSDRRAQVREDLEYNLKMLATRVAAMMDGLSSGMIPVVRTHGLTGLAMQVDQQVHELGLLQSLIADRAPKKPVKRTGPLKPITHVTEGQMMVGEMVRARLDHEAESVREFFKLDPIKQAQIDPNEPDRLIGLVEATQILGVSDGLVSQLVRNGKLDYVHADSGNTRLGRPPRRYLLSDVRRLAAERAANPAKRGPKPGSKMRRKDE